MDAKRRRQQQLIGDRRNLLGDEEWSNVARLKLARWLLCLGCELEVSCRQQDLVSYFELFVASLRVCVVCLTLLCATKMFFGNLHVLLHFVDNGVRGWNVV